MCGRPRNAIPRAVRSQIEFGNEGNLLLAESLIGQKHYAEAEPVLLKVYEGRKAHEEKTPPRPGTVNPRIVKALDHLITLYTATNNPDDVNKWQAERAKYADVSTKPGEKK